MLPFRPLAKKCPVNLLPPVFGTTFIVGPPTSVSPSPPEVDIAISAAFSVSCR